MGMARTSGASSVVKRRMILALVNSGSSSRLVFCHDGLAILYQTHSIMPRPL